MRTSLNKLFMYLNKYKNLIKKITYVFGDLNLVKLMYNFTRLHLFCQNSLKYVL